MRERGGFAVRLSGVQMPGLSHSSCGTLDRVLDSSHTHRVMVRKKEPADQVFPAPRTQ